MLATKIIAKAQADHAAGVSLSAGRANIKGAAEATIYLKAYIAAIATDPRAIAASVAR